MSTTIKKLIDAAYAQSSANDPGKIATDAELIMLVDRRCKRLYSRAARKNPWYFGASANVAGDGVKWPRPATAELVFRAESAGGAGSGANKKIAAVGTEVSVVPFDDRDAELAPRIYPLGRAYYTVGIAATDPDVSANGDLLKFFFSRRHADFDPLLASDHATNTLEADWPEQFNDLFVLHIGRYLSRKDVMRDQGEYGALSDELKDVEALFEEHLEHELLAMKARWGQLSRPTEPISRGADVR